MRLLADARGEVGVFEDLQTLAVIVVGLVVLLGSTLFNWSSFGDVQEDQELYDEAEHLIESIEAWNRLRAINQYGSQYEAFYLRQYELATMYTKSPNQFREQIRSDLSYNITFDDLHIPDSDHRPEEGNFSYYSFGKGVPEDVERVEVQVQYALVFDVRLDSPQEWNVSVRHPCLVSVVVWR